MVWDASLLYAKVWPLYIVETTYKYLSCLGRVDILLLLIRQTLESSGNLPIKNFAKKVASAKKTRSLEGCAKSENLTSMRFRSAKL